MPKSNNITKQENGEGICISGNAGSGKTRILATLCAGNPNGILYTCEEEPEHLSVRYGIPVERIEVIGIRTITDPNYLDKLDKDKTHYIDSTNLIFDPSTHMNFGPGSKIPKNVVLCFQTARAEC